MFSWLFSWMKSKCYICKSAAKAPRQYLDDRGQRIVVCQKCMSYAERRAYRKIM